MITNTDFCLLFEDQSLCQSFVSELEEALSAVDHSSQVFRILAISCRLVSSDDVYNQWCYDSRFDWNINVIPLQDQDLYSGLNNSTLDMNLPITVRTSLSYSLLFGTNFNNLVNSKFSKIWSIIDSINAKSDTFQSEPNSIMIFSLTISILIISVLVFALLLLSNRRKQMTVNIPIKQPVTDTHLSRFRIHFCLIVFVLILLLLLSIAILIFFNFKISNLIGVMGDLTNVSTDLEYLSFQTFQSVLNGVPASSSHSLITPTLVSIRHSYNSFMRSSKSVDHDIVAIFYNTQFTEDTTGGFHVKLLEIGEIIKKILQNELLGAQLSAYFKSCTTARELLLKGQDVLLSVGRQFESQGRSFFFTMFFASIVAIVFAYFFFRKMFVVLNQEQKTVLCLLKMLPKEAVDRVPQLHEYISQNEFNYHQLHFFPLPQKNDTEAKEEEEPESEEENAEETASPEYQIAPVLTEQSLLRIFGAALPAPRVSYVNALITSLSLSHPTDFESLRFFGCILTLADPIYVAEAIPTEDYLESLSQNDQEEKKEEEEEEEEKDEDGPKPMETVALDFKGLPAGEGVNKFVYYAYINNEWVLLPNFSPLFKLLDRGQFVKNSNDPENLKILRYRIALISHSTVLSPKNLFLGPLDEDNEDEEEKRLPVWEIGSEEVADAADFPYVDAKTTEFAHRLPKLCPNGKTKEEENEDEEEEENEQSDEEEVDVIESQVKISRENGSKLLQSRADLRECRPLPCFRDLEGNWQTQRFGDSVFAKSLDFPGAVSVMRLRSFANFYCGYGLSNSPINRVSMVTPEVLSLADFNQVFLEKAVEHDEPTPEQEGWKPEEKEEEQNEEDEEGEEQDDEED
ncbi:hypothetical protein GEMRC1_006781 [Eukaryota sp. GEM-RC1]